MTKRISKPTQAESKKIFEFIQEAVFTGVEKAKETLDSFADNVANIVVEGENKLDALNQKAALFARKIPDINLKYEAYKTTLEGVFKADDKCLIGISQLFNEKADYLKWSLKYLDIWREQQWAGLADSKPVQDFQDLPLFLQAAKEIDAQCWLKKPEDPNEMGSMSQPAISQTALFIQGDSPEDKVIWPITGLEEYSSKFGYSKQALYHFDTFDLLPHPQQMGELVPLNPAELNIIDSEQLVWGTLHFKAQGELSPLPTAKIIKNKDDLILGYRLRDKTQGQILWGASSGLFYLKRSPGFDPAQEIEIELVAFRPDRKLDFLYTFDVTKNLAPIQKEALNPLTKEIFDKVTQFGDVNKYGNYALTKAQQLEVATAYLKSYWDKYELEPDIQALLAKGREGVKLLHDPAGINTANCRLANMELYLAARAYGFNVGYATGYRPPGKDSKGNTGFISPGHAWVELLDVNAGKEVVLDATPGNNKAEVSDLLNDISSETHNSFIYLEEHAAEIEKRQGFINKAKEMTLQKEGLDLDGMIQLSQLADKIPNQWQMPGSYQRWELPPEEKITQIDVSQYRSDQPDTGDGSTNLPALTIVGSNGEMISGPMAKLQTLTLLPIKNYDMVTLADGTTLPIYGTSHNKDFAIVDKNKKTVSLEELLSLDFYPLGKFVTSEGQSGTAYYNRESGIIINEPYQLAGILDAKTNHTYHLRWVGQNGVPRRLLAFEADFTPTQVANIEPALVMSRNFVHVMQGRDIDANDQQSVEVLKNIYQRLLEHPPNFIVSEAKIYGVQGNANDIAAIYYIIDQAKKLNLDKPTSQIFSNGRSVESVCIDPHRDAPLNQVACHKQMYASVSLTDFEKDFYQYWQNQNSESFFRGVFKPYEKNILEEMLKKQP